MGLKSRPGRHPQSRQSAWLSLQSSELVPRPLTRKRASEGPPPPPLIPRWETHSPAGEGAGGAHSSDEGTDTLVL
jgi:hypothetical protein